MKKLLLVLLAGVSLVGSSPSAHAFEMGVIGVMNTIGAKNTPDNPPKPSTIATFGGGVYGAVDLMMPSLSLEIGLNYAQRRTKVEGNPTIESGLTYLEIPVVVRYTFLPMINIGAGLYYAAGIGNVDYIVTPSGGSSTQSSKTPGELGYQSLDYGLLFSLGAKVPAGVMSVVVNANYMMGMRDIYSSNGVTTKWGGFQFQLGAQFAI